MWLQEISLHSIESHTISIPRKAARKMFPLNLWLMILILISIVKADTNETFSNENLNYSIPMDFSGKLLSVDTTEATNNSFECDEETVGEMNTCDKNNSSTNLSSILPVNQENHFKMAEHIMKICCDIRAMFLYISVDIDVSSNWANRIVRGLSECTSDGVILMR